MVTRFYSPLGTLLGLQKALEDTMATEWFGPAATTSRGAYPPVNIFQENDAYVLIAEIPGAKREDLEIQVKGNQVRLAGKKTVDYGAKTSIHRRERNSGHFDRIVTLPFEVNSEGVKAEFRNGVLALSIPRAESDKPRVVSIA